MIEEPEHRLFFIDAFGEPTFQRMNDIHKMEIETLLGYKMMASNVKTAANQVFSVVMSKMIDDRPDKDKIMNMKVKLESLGYTDYLSMSKGFSIVVDFNSLIDIVQEN
ncbi:hypothetical protein Tco_1475711 [Tanacetum coccineum]